METEVVGRKEVLVRLPAKLYLLAKEKAKIEGKSFNQLIVEALEKHVSTQTDGNHTATIAPYVVVQKPSIKEVEGKKHPCQGCGSFNPSRNYCYAYQCDAPAPQCKEWREKSRE